MNLSKTQIIYNELTDNEEITIDNITLEAAGEFIYLEQLIKKSGSLLLQINRNIKVGKNSGGKEKRFKRKTDQKKKESKEKNVSPICITYD